jgi:hypothetical protein
MHYYNQIAKLNVADKIPAIIKRLETNVALLTTLTTYDLQPKTRAKLETSIMCDMVTAAQKKLLTCDVYGYVVHNHTKYNPSTGVFVLNDLKCSPDYNGYIDERFITFTKPVVIMTEDEIRNANTQPANIPEKHQASKRCWGDKTARYTPRRYYDAVQEITRSILVDCDGEYYRYRFNPKMDEEDARKLIKDTPMIVYMIIPLMMGTKTQTLMNMVYDAAPYDYPELFKMAQAQESSHFDLFINDDDDKYSCGEIANKLYFAIRIYRAAVQLFDTTMAHDINLRNNARTMSSLTVLSDTEKQYLQDKGYLTVDDELYNYTDHGCDSSYITLSKVKVPTNDSLLRLKTVIDETRLKQDTEWDWIHSAATAILETIRDADMEYEEIDFTPINNLSAYPLFDTYSNYNYYQPDKTMESSHYYTDFTSSGVLLGIGAKKDLMTMYSLLYDIAGRNEYFGEILFGANLLKAKYKPDFKLDNEIYKDVLCDLLTDEEIEDAMSRIEAWSDKYYGIKNSTMVYGDDADVANHPEYYDNDDDFAVCFKDMVHTLRYDYVPHITFDRNNTERKCEYYDQVRYHSIQHYIHIDQGSVIGYRSERNCIAYKAVLEALEDCKNVHYEEGGPKDDFIILTAFNPSSIVDSGYTEIS